MDADDGLVRGLVLDGRGGGRRLGWEDVRTWRPEDGVLWVHLDRGTPRAEAWLEHESGLDAVVVGALLAEETRPRCSVLPRGLLLILRGVNLNPGADPEDMVSLRLWIEAGRVLSLRRRRVMAVQDVHDTLEAGHGPATPAAVVAALAERLIERMGPVVGGLDEQLDDLEVAALEGDADDLRPRLAALRREAIALRRYIAPQRDALIGLGAAPTALLGDGDRLRLREVSDRVTRYVEDLDAVRERAAVTHDELGTRLSEVMNQRMYVLSLVAAVFLPLGLLTGLLGINVGGIPGTESDWGFAAVTVVLVGMGLATGWWLRRSF